MAYVPVPKDLTKIKTKVLFNLTQRQLICFGSGALLGVPLFFLAKAHTNSSTATLLMVLSMLPCFLLALYERNGQPLERIAHHIIQARFLRPKRRPYKTDNYYAALGRQITLDQEVKAIVQQYRQTQAHPGGEKPDRRRHHPSKG